MKAIISRKEPVAKLTLYTELDLLGKKADFKAGQYFFITLKPDDTAHRDDLTHHFSIVSSPNQRGALAFTTRLRLRESLFKRTLNDSQIGDVVEIGKIEGSFVLPESTDKPIVCIALGIGITPYISMLRFAVEENQDHKFTLIYSDDEAQSMSYLDDLERLDKKQRSFRLIVTVTHQDGWEGENRHVDGQFLKDYFEDITNNLYYVSGPPKAVESVTNNLKKSGIPEGYIKTDSFTGY